jgi:hypothetical protein
MDELDERLASTREVTTMPTLVRLFATSFIAIAAMIWHAAAAAVDILWYTYSDPASEYRSFYSTLAGSGVPHPTGKAWSITFYGPKDPVPDFTRYNLLVIHSGEAFRTGAPGQPNMDPDYTGIFRNKAAIDAARGNRTFLSGADADFHSIRGDSGVCGSGSWCLDGALGYLINAVNWASGGQGLGILSFVDGDFPGSFWWDTPDSFLRDELHGNFISLRENNVVITPAQATYPTNLGLTSAGLSNWTNSFHAGFVKTMPWYSAIVDSGTQPAYALTVTTEAVGRIVVEYVNTADFPSSPGGHFFYSSDRAEQSAVDHGSAGAFVRTGRSFLIGGSSPVCRFYGSVRPGPNSHFFTVDADECNALKAAQVVPTPTTVQQWNYEGIAYSTTPVSIAADGTRSCPAGTLPLYRAYNNAFPASGPRNPWDSNHRFTLVREDVTTLVALGWRDEGIVFCTAGQ